MFDLHLFIFTIIYMIAHTTGMNHLKIKQILLYKSTQHMKYVGSIGNKNVESVYKLCLRDWNNRGNEF